MEYSRKVPLMANGMPLEGAGAGERQLDFGSVHIKEELEKKETKMLNVSLCLNEGPRAEQTPKIEKKLGNSDSLHPCKLCLKGVLGCNGMA